MKHRLVLRYVDSVAVNNLFAKIEKYDSQRQSVYGSLIYAVGFSSIY